MEKVLDFIKIGAGVVIVLALLGWVFIIKDTSEKPISAGVNKTAELSEELVDSEKTKYNNLEVSGEQVVDTIDDLKTDLSTTFYINVITLGDATGTTFATTTPSLPAKGSLSYINPRGTFKGSLAYDTNKALKGLIFTQIK